MKKAALALAGLLFPTFIGGTAMATETYQIFGQVKEVGIDRQVKVGTHYESEMYFYLTGNCGGATGYNFLITLRSGNTPARIENYHNIYATLLAALENNSWIRFDGNVVDCSQTNITLPAYNALVGMFSSDSIEGAK
jgi:hypothetical protein